MDETKQTHATDTEYLRSNGMRLGTGCAHAQTTKNNLGGDKKKRTKKVSKTDS
jgi:hypothetical protein